MPALWHGRLKFRSGILAAMAIAGLWLCLDTNRPPGRQLSARLCVGLVHLYQENGRPISTQFIRCRYVPTCSEYSVQAFQKYGFFRGLELTVRRIFLCRGTVPYGTRDPVP